MKENITVQAQVREGTGSSAAGRLRRQGSFPAVMYGKGKSEILLQVNRRDFERMLSHHQSEHMMLDLAIEGQDTHRVLLENVQHHPISTRVIHADFQEVALDERLRVEIPIELTGEPIGVSRDGGVLEHLLRVVEVECLPGDIVESVSVDVSGMEIGHHLSISDVHLDPDRFTVVTESSIAIATVAAPRVEEEAGEEEGAEAAEGAEPELVSAKDEEAAEKEE